MATWIVHLRVAETLLSAIQGLDSALFAIGNIAPDSGIPDEKRETFTPPVEVTHFSPPNPAAFRAADLAFLREYLLPFRQGGLEPAALSFRLGYFFHLVTDNLWVADIYWPTLARFRAQFEADPDFVWEVKKDWYGLDHQFVRENPASLFWQVFLDCEYQRSDLAFLPLQAVQQRIRYIQDYYRADTFEVREMLGRPFIYLSKGEMDDFVQHAGQRLLRIYNSLWLDGQAPLEGASVLETIA